MLTTNLCPLKPIAEGFIRFVTQVLELAVRSEFKLGPTLQNATACKSPGFPPALNSETQHNDSIHSIWSPAKKPLDHLPPICTV